MIAVCSVSEEVKGAGLSVGTTWLLFPISSLIKMECDAFKMV